MSDFGWWAEQAKEEAMKVRCKGFGINTPVEWTVVEESSRYYIVKSDSTLGLACLDKAYYEPVQEWVPVYTFEMCGMKDKEIRARHSGNGFITVEVKR